jgi:hypothetical protein
LMPQGLRQTLSSRNGQCGLLNWSLVFSETIDAAQISAFPLLQDGGQMNSR